MSEILQTITPFLEKRQKEEYSANGLLVFLLALPSFPALLWWLKTVKRSSLFLAIVIALVGFLILLAIFSSIFNSLYRGKFFSDVFKPIHKLDPSSAKDLIMEIAQADNNLRSRSELVNEWFKRNPMKSPEDFKFGAKIAVEEKCGYCENILNPLSQWVLPNLKKYGIEKSRNSNDPVGDFAYILMALYNSESQLQTIASKDFNSGLCKILDPVYNKKPDFFLGERPQKVEQATQMREALAEINPKAGGKLGGYTVGNTYFKVVDEKHFQILRLGVMGWTYGYQKSRTRKYAIVDTFSMDCELTDSQVKILGGPSENNFSQTT